MARMSWLKRHEARLAFAAVALVSVYGVARAESVADDAKKAAAEAERAVAAVDREATARALAQCESSNEARQGIREFVTFLIDRDGRPRTPGEEAIVAATDERFAPLVCPTG